MYSKFVRLGVAAAASLLLIAGLPASAQSPQVIDLGTLGGPNSSAYGINNFGQVVGTSDLAEADGSIRQHAFLWESGVMTDIGTLTGPEGDFSSALDINDSAQVVGQSRNDAGNDVAFMWQGGVMHELPGLDLDNYNSAAKAINEAGVVVGWSNVIVGCPENRTCRHAAMWEDGAVVDLGTLGGSFSTALAINNRGQIVGFSETAEGDVHAFLWEHGVVTDLGAIAGWQYSSANMINNRGKIIGEAGNFGEPSHPVMWYRGDVTTLEDLYPSLGYYDVSPQDLNETGTIAGYYWPLNWPTLPYHPFVFANGIFLDLAEYWGSPGIAWSVNNNGWVAGEGTVVVEFPDPEDPESTITEEHPRAYLWIP